MPNSQQPALLAHPPPLYRPSQSAPLSQVSSQTLPPPTSHYQFSLSPFSPVSRTHQSRRAPRSLDTSPSNSDLSEFFPPQTGVASPTTPAFSQSLFSPSSPFTPRKISSGATSLILDNPREFIQRKTLSEIQILTDTQYSQLKFLCSNKTISPYDSEAWEAMLGGEKFPTTNSGQDAYDVEMATVSLSIEFASNNKKTANFNTLLLHVLSQMRRVIDPEFNGEIPVEAYNSLFLVRVFSKHFIGNLSRDEIHRQFEGNHAILTESPRLNGFASTNDENRRVSIDPETVQDTRPKAEQLLDGLLTIILKLDPVSNASTYEYYQECLNILLVLISTQIHQSNASQMGNNYFLDILLTNFSDFVNKLTKRLVANFIEQKPPPPSSTSVVYNAYSYLFPSRSSATLLADPPPIAERSLLILLLLSVQCRTLDDKAKSFREGIRSLKDAQGMEESDMAISFRVLYQLICRQLPNEEICLILYLLMVENEDFRVYVLSRLDPEILLLQILRLLYDGIDSRTNYSQMYILLTILLLFSQDEVFNENIQKISISYQPWFTERLLKSVSLGGLTYLVLIRIIQFNLSSHRDVYFHTNCLATMANLGNSIQDIHPYVAQRLVNLFDIVAKRYQKLIKKAQQQGEGENTDAVTIYGDIVCLVLEIINSVLTRRLNSNPELIYSLLHKKDLFTHFRLHPRFAELIANIDNVISYFHARISEANLKSPSSEEISELIETAARTWPPSRLKEFPDLKFQYEEESESQEFFCPYVWALIYRHTWIYWDEDKIHILSDYTIQEEIESSAVQVV